jgi:glycosyltransferase involved in cell wall biosynthesis
MNWSGLLIDATSLDNESRYRGIGTYNRQIVGALEQQADLDFRLLRLSNSVQAPQTMSIWRPQKPAVRLQWLWHRLFLPGELRRSGARVYHAIDPHCNVQLPNLYRIATFYDLIPLALEKYYLRGRLPDGRIGYFWMLSMLESADRIISISEFSKAELVRLRGVDPQKIVVIPLGYDTARFDQPEDLERTTALQATYGDFVVYSGSLDYHKNLSAMLQALTLLPARLRFLVTGRAPASALRTFFAEATRLGVADRVVHLGFVADDTLPHLYRAARAYVLPSLLEGFGLPMLDAMACGVPVIAARAASLPEVGGDAPLYFDPQVPAELATEIHRLLDDSALAAQITQRGRERVHQFSWQKAASATIAVYREALACL